MHAYDKYHFIVLCVRLKNSNIVLKTEALLKPD